MANAGVCRIARRSAKLAANQRRLRTGWFGTVINNSEGKLALRPAEVQEDRRDRDEHLRHRTKRRKLAANSRDKDPRFDCELNQIGGGLEIKFLHDAVLVKCDGPWSHI